MAKKIIHWVTGVVGISGAGTDTIVDIDLNQAASWPNGVTQDNCSLLIDASWVGRNTSGAVGATGAGKVYASAKRVSGTVTVVSAIPSTLGLTSEAGVAGVSATIDSSGTTVRLRMTGIAANDIEFFGDMRIYVN
jgi:hypothetical protein